MCIRDRTYTEPGLQGDRSTGGTKPATVETGAEIQVPLFLETGTRVKAVSYTHLDVYKRQALAAPQWHRRDVHRAARAGVSLLPGAHRIGTR